MLMEELHDLDLPRVNATPVLKKGQFILCRDDPPRIIKQVRLSPVPGLRFSILQRLLAFGSGPFQLLKCTLQLRCDGATAFPSPSMSSCL